MQKTEFDLVNACDLLTTPLLPHPKRFFMFSALPSLRCLVFILACLLWGRTVARGQITVIKRQGFSGTIESVSGNTVKVKTADGSKSFQFTKPGDTTTPLIKGGINLRHQTTIDVSGKIPFSKLSVGQAVKFSAELSRPGKSKGEVELFELVDTDSPSVITPERAPENSRDFVKCQVVGRIESIRRTAIQISTDKQEFAPQGRLRIRASEDAVVDVSENSLDRCGKGDIVKSLAALELNTGDWVVEKLVVEISPKEVSTKTKKSNTRKSKDPLSPENYVKYSGQPGKPRDLRSQHFLLHTDLSDRSAKMLLDKLEYMIGLISQYYGRLPKGIIECYVVRDLSLWTDIPMHPNGVSKIREGAGVTISQGALGKVKAVVYSSADHGVVQHESVHAYCSQTFGSTGPTWYSEGMAEMGQYWKKGNLAVNISPPVIRYLTRATPKKLLDIVAAGQITGDSWQAYAWRWALCHMLASNSNYSPRFKGLGINMMSGGQATFESVYGDVAKEISFEYDQFVKNFGNGYRVDLCQWDWKSKANAITGNRRIQAKIEAARGWQTSKLKLNKGKKYEFVCVGEWSTSAESKPVNGDGDTLGKGKLVAVVFQNYQLSKVIELGQKGEFVAEQDGHLFLRCLDSFSELEDNSGTLTVHFRRAK